MADVHLRNSLNYATCNRQKVVSDGLGLSTVASLIHILAVFPTAWHWHM
jgi:hypothetical protein